MFVSDFIINGRAHGAVGDALQSVRYDPGFLRPYLDKNNVPCVTVNSRETRTDSRTGREVRMLRKVRIADLASRGIFHPVWNEVSLRRDEWIKLDTAVTRAVRQPMRAWTDLVNASPYGGFDAMARMTIEHQLMNEFGEAIQDMDVLAEDRSDSPLFKTRSTPLPITHSGFTFGARRLAISANGGQPLDTLAGEEAGRRVGEMIERQTIGVENGMAFGTDPDRHDGLSRVYGWTNFPYRTTKTDLTTPTGANPEAVMADVLEMVDLLVDMGFTGPYVLYTSRAYSRYLSDDYFRAGSTAASRTLRDRLMEIEGISDIRRLAYLTTGFQMILVQLDSRTARGIDGMGPVTVQWESKGGMQKHYKVIAIQVPQLMADYEGNTAIVHATTA